MDNVDVEQHLCTCWTWKGVCDSKKLMVLGVINTVNNMFSAIVINGGTLQSVRQSIGELRQIFSETLCALVRGPLVVLDREYRKWLHTI